MRLTRTEKVQENQKLDELLKLAPDFENSISELPPDLSPAQQRIFLAAYNFLERERKNRAEKGRKKKVRDSLRDKIISMLDSGAMSIEDVSEVLGISTATAYRYRNEKKNSISDKSSKEQTDTSSEIFLQLANGKTDRLSTKEQEDLKNGFLIIRQHRNLAGTRQKNLKKGRLKLMMEYEKTGSRPEAIKKIRQRKMNP